MSVPEISPASLHVPAQAPAGNHRKHLHNRDCYVCGEGEPCGLGVEFVIGPDGSATADWQPSARFQSFPDRLHGGVLAALADGAMLHALLGMGLGGVTVEMSVRYLRAANLREPVRVSGRVLSGRHGLFRCAATVEQGGVPVVRATARFMTGPGAGLPSGSPPE
ncbi:MAG: PaaI family thioesterase [Verrucomicrobia bacterium]|nr:PaaI family thioesterase [Verrucomicrobiota bacterium]